ncbi:MAG: biopolymer transporter ExbD [Pirellulaceae bacterium]|nr:biopolymer transporter ExbD [Pirellulaceae bacterium]
MKFRNREHKENTQLSMTAMIDIVFLLLVFFVMTFKISAQEGDFNIRMPTPGSGAAMDSTQLIIKLRLKSDEHGQLQEIILNDQMSFGTNWQSLRAKMIELVGDPSGPTAEEGPEVEIDLDYDLHYVHVIQAITSVTGYRSGDDIVRLVQRIKFAPVRR